MKAWEYRAVAYDGAVYCVGCRPSAYHRLAVESPEPVGCPVFAVSEWDYYPSCDACGRVHEYIGLTDDGRTYERRQHLTRMIRERARALGK